MTALAMLTVFDGRELCGFVLKRGRAGFEASIATKLRSVSGTAAAMRFPTMRKRPPRRGASDA
jgi:hypothetical protein